MLLVMTMLLVMSPIVSAQATPEAPVDGIETTIDDTTTDEGSAPAAPTAPDEATPPSASETTDSSSTITTQSRQIAPDISVQAVGDGTIVVNVVGSDPDQPVPTGAFVCVSIVWNCATWTGTPLSFTVPAGEYTVSFDQFDESYYTDTNTTVTVGEGETVDLTLTLEPRQPSTLRLYVSTDTGVPVPAGTEACVYQDATAFTPEVDTCQDVTGLAFADFAVNEGWVDFTVTTPADSGFAGTSEQIWVPGGTVYRDYAVLVDDADGTVTIDVATEDGVTLNGAPDICFQRADEPLEYCSWVGNPEFDNDGGGNYTFQVPAGTWTWAVQPSFMDNVYLPVSGTVTVADGDQLVIEATLPLRTEADQAIVSVSVRTFDGAEVPAGTEVCVSDVISANCVTWEGEVLDLDVAAGPVSLNVVPPDDSGYTGYTQFMPLVATGETRAIDAVVYRLDTPLTLEKTVSNTEPESGDTVVYRIHAYGPAYEFLIEDELPVELTDVTVTCSGSFSSELPGACYESYDGMIVVPGIAGNMSFMDVTIEVTGTVTGDAGTTVSNTACVTSFVWTGDEVACDVASLVIAETLLPTPDPTETPDATVTPDPTGTPTTPDTTPVPSVTPAPTQPAPAETPTAPAAPSPVTALPNTGDAASSSAPLALIVALTSAAVLAGAAAVRLRWTTRG